MEEGVILPFANVYPVYSIHCEEYASPASEKLTVKLGRQSFTLMPVNIRQNGTNGLLKRKKKIILSLEILISERDAGNNAREN